MSESIEFFHIDKHRLDDEWFSHPRKFHQVAMQAAESRSAFEKAKANKELVAATLSIQIRKNPDKFGLEKVTDSAIEKMVVMNEEYQNANDELLDAKKQMDEDEVAVQTMDHRKKALEKSVDLFLSDYWSTPRSRNSDTRNAVSKAERETAFVKKREVKLGE